MEDNKPQASVSIDDVRAALGETDPHKTNAGKLRAIIGRGSLRTIQNHLETIRAAAIAAVAEAGEADTIPVVPKELADALWQAAWNAAQGRTARRMLTLTTERDDLTARVESLTADLEAAIGQFDEAEARAADAAERAKVATEAQEALKKEIELLVAEAAQKAAEVALKAAQELTDAKHAHQLDLANWNAERATMQREIDRMVNNLSEVKSLLHKPAEQTQPQPQK